MECVVKVIGEVGGIPPTKDCRQNLVPGMEWKQKPSWVADLDYKLCSALVGSAPLRCSGGEQHQGSRRVIKRLCFLSSDWAIARYTSIHSCRLCTTSFLGLPSWPTACSLLNFHRGWTRLLSSTILKREQARTWC